MSPTTPGAPSSAASSPARGLAIGFVVLFLFALALAGKADRTELVAALVAAAFGTLALHATGELERFGLPRRAPGVLAKLPARVVTESWKVLRVLARAARERRRPEGRLREIPFDPGPDDDAGARARRAWVVAALSLAPNGFVVDVDRERGVLLVHELEPDESDRERDPEWPL